MAERIHGNIPKDHVAQDNNEVRTPVAIETVSQPIQDVLESLWEFAVDSPDMTDELRGALAQIITAYAASEPRLPPESTAPQDVVDAQEALAISGYRSENSIRNAVREDRLPVHHERITPAGYVVRYFLRSDVERLRDNRLSRRSM